MNALDRYLISNDKALLELDSIHAFLVGCYWSPGITKARVARAIEHSLCWGAYDTTTPRERPGQFAQVGFARVVTDRASFAYLCDVYVLEEHRGVGLGVRLMEAVMDCADLRGLRRFCLMTRDAHTLYRRFGFAPMPEPSRYMERVDRESYKLAQQE